MDLKKIDSKVLAAQIVAYRLIGINKDLALKCMEELSVRRDSGDVFDYEQYIEEKTKVDLPETIDKSKLADLIKFKG